jgi:hypothetical protein
MDLTKYFVLFILLNYLNVQLYFLNIYTNYKKFKNEFYLDFILIYFFFDKQKLITFH